jgi:acyl carrier protein
MSADEIRAVVLRTLDAVVPGADLAHLTGDVNFREELDLDSMDFLNFVIALHKQLHVDIPERDYRKLGTLNGCVAYLAGLPALQSLK